jgi:uncharacterized protein YfiM (DUF2279 family)
MLPTLPQDKANHVAYGAAIACVAVIVLSLFGMPNTAVACWALVASLLVGAAKELIDSRNPERHTADWMDATYTLAGALLVCVPVLICNT